MAWKTFDFICINEKCVNYTVKVERMVKDSEKNSQVCEFCVEVLIKGFGSISIKTGDNGNRLKYKGEMVMTKEELPKPILLEDLGIIFATENSKRKFRYGIYKCGFCGTEFRANTQNILKGVVKSCGCYQKRRVSEANKTHGLKSTKLYDIWGNIKGRVLNPKNKRYTDYGGRGITICEEWLDIHNFYDWAMSNGYSDELSIDRIDNDGNYCPENCRWVNSSIQNRNKRISKNNTSGYKGVSYNRSRGKYIAKICVNKKNIHLGYFQTAEEGAIAYNNYIIENNLEGFILNEIPNKSLTDE